MPNVVPFFVFEAAVMVFCGSALWYLCRVTSGVTSPQTANKRTDTRGVTRLLVALFTVLLILGVVVHSSPLPGESALREAMDEVTDNSAILLVVQAINLVDRYRLWFVLDLAIAVVFLRQKASRAAIAVIGGALAIEAMTALLLIIVARPRPDALISLSATFDALNAGSFPPGPAARTFVAVGVALLAIARYAPPHVRLALIIATALLGASGLAQVVGVEHWPSDLAGGYMEGAIGLSLISLAVRRPQETIRSPSRPASTDSAQFAADEAMHQV